MRTFLCDLHETYGHPILCVQLQNIGRNFQVLYSNTKLLAVFNLEAKSHNIETNSSQVRRHWRAAQNWMTSIRPYNVARFFFSITNANEI